MIIASQDGQYLIPIESCVLKRKKTLWDDEHPVVSIIAHVHGTDDAVYEIGTYRTWGDSTVVFTEILQAIKDDSKIFIMPSVDSNLFAD